MRLLCAHDMRCLQVTELKLKVDNVERERDFYFDKLRDIEILCQMPLLQSVPVRPGSTCPHAMAGFAPSCYLCFICAGIQNVLASMSINHLQRCVSRSVSDQLTVLRCAKVHGCTYDTCCRCHSEICCPLLNTWPCTSTVRSSAAALHATWSCISCNSY